MKKQYGGMPVNKRLCTICMDHSVETILLPCRHSILCKECYDSYIRRNRYCPVCRKYIVTKIDKYSNNNFVSDSMDQITVIDVNGKEVLYDISAYAIVGDLIELIIHPEPLSESRIKLVCNGKTLNENEPINQYIGQHITIVEKSLLELTLPNQYLPTIACGLFFTCAVTSKNNIVYAGKVEDPLIREDDKIRMIVSSNDSIVALCESGTIYWNSSNSRIKFPEVNFKMVASGGCSTIVGLTFGNKILILTSNYMDEIPRLHNDEQFKMVSCGYNYILGLTLSGHIYGWGSDEYGLISQIPNSQDREFVYVSSGSHHAAGLTSKGEIYCWGNDRKQQVSGVPKLYLNETFTHVACGDRHTVGVTTENRIICWGDYGAGQRINTPKLSLEEKIINLTCGMVHNAVLTLDGQLLCWGSDSNGKLEIPRYLDDDESYLLD